MVERDSNIPTLFIVHPGQRIEVWNEQVLHCRGLAGKGVSDVGVV